MAYRESVARDKRKEFADWEYWGRPVPGFGSVNAPMMIVGLAPAAHGGNRTGRVFTGDRSGDFLFRCLFKTGFANQPLSVNRQDGLELTDAYVTASVKCAPPNNKPTSQETKNCSRFLSNEIALLSRRQIILCLGQLAYTAVMKSLAPSFDLPEPLPRFAHGLRVELANQGLTVVASYHPSPRNTQTGKLTEKMFLGLLEQLRAILQQS